MRIGKGVAQSAAGEIRRARNEGHGFAGRHSHTAASPGPEPGERPEDQRLPGTRIADDVDRWPGAISIRDSASLVRPERETTSRFSNVMVALSFWTNSIRFSSPCSVSAVISARRKAATRSSVARQSVIALTLATNHFNDECTWLNAPTAS